MLTVPSQPRPIGLQINGGNGAGQMPHCQQESLMDMSCAAWTDDSEGGHGRIACVMGETQLGHEACIACPNELMARQNGKCDEGTAGAQNVWGRQGHGQNTCAG